VCSVPPPLPVPLSAGKDGLAFRQKFSKVRCIAFSNS
jgi:hypothetical protein